MKYYVRKSWEDKESQIGKYTNLQEALENCPFPYTVFNRNGKALICTAKINNINSGIVHAYYDKMWERLKEEYTTNLNHIVSKKCSKKLSDSELVLELFYSDLLSKMEEIEKEETKVIR